MATKCVIIVMPRWLVNFRRRGKFFLIVEHLSQMYRMVLPVPQWYDYFMADFDIAGDYFGIVATAVYIFLKVCVIFLIDWRGGGGGGDVDCVYVCVCVWA